MYHNSMYSILTLSTLFASFSAPPVCLLPNSHYEQIMSAFGGKGYFVKTPEELQNALKASLAEKQVPSLINVMINPQSDRKQQVRVFIFLRLWWTDPLYPPEPLLRHGERLLVSSEALWRCRDPHMLSSLSYQGLWLHHLPYLYFPNCPYLLTILLWVLSQYQKSFLCAPTKEIENKMIFS